jgi:PKD repeat protein
MSMGNPRRAVRAARILASVLIVWALAFAGCRGTTPAAPAAKPAAPAAAFTLSPSSPTASQNVQFNDTSTGGPTTWSWNFGDGGVSAVQNPVHAFSAAGTYTVGLTAGNAGGSTTVSRSVTVGDEVAPSTLNIILGRPTGTSIDASVMGDAGTDVMFEYGTAPGSYSGQTLADTVVAGAPRVIGFTGLQPNTRYFYRARYRPRGEAGYRADVEHSFQTARSPGGSFSFGIQGDSHPERQGQMFNPDLYAINMKNVAARQPDFYVAMGDDFSIERLIASDTLTQDNVNQVYQYQRTYFGLFGAGTPLFLVNGNHEQAAAYLLSDRYVTPYRDAPIFAGRARVAYYPLPVSNPFYSADTTDVPGIGPIRDYYAFEWGDALFVTIDPYWHSPVPVDSGVPGVGKTSDQWQITMGDEQYAWFKRTLETSRAKYKFVFEHHVLGTGRGAAAIVHTYEWGWYNQKGTAYEFRSMRPSWPRPIHQLMNDNKVTVFFFGHDHLFAREKVDGVIYQEVPNPADNTYTAFNADAYAPPSITFPGATYDPNYSVTMPNAGFLQVTVAPDRVTVSYIRAVLPGDEAKAGAVNGAIAYSYTVTPVPAERPATTQR